jgi:hypothetical protein
MRRTGGAPALSDDVGKGNSVVEDATTFVGKDLSLWGIGFSQDRPLLNRPVVISLDHPKVGRLSVEAEIVGARQAPIGLYDSGCRMLMTAMGHVFLPR